MWFILRSSKLSKEQKIIVKDYKINVKKEVLIFLEDMERIRSFINTAVKEELTLIGSIKPIQILDSWDWSDDNNSVRYGVNHFVDEPTSESSSAETVSEDVVIPKVGRGRYYSDESVASEEYLDESAVSEEYSYSFESGVEQIQ